MTSTLRQRSPRVILVAMVASSLLVLMVLPSHSSGPPECVLTPCSDPSATVYLGGNASGGGVLNFGAAAAGGVVAVGVTGAATGAVLNISNLRNGTPSFWRDPTLNDYGSSVPGCNQVPDARPFGSLPLHPDPVDVDDAGQLTASITGNTWAGCNNPSADPTFGGTYADAFLLDCSVRYDGADASEVIIELQADWYRGNRPPTQYQEGDSAFHHNSITFDAEQAVNGVREESYTFPLVDWAQRDRHYVAMACRAIVTHADGTQTASADAPQPYIAFQVPIQGDPIVL